MLLNSIKYAIFKVKLHDGIQDAAILDPVPLRSMRRDLCDLLMTVTRFDLDIITQTPIFTTSCNVGLQ